MKRYVKSRRNALCVNNGQLGEKHGLLFDCRKSLPSCRNLESGRDNMYDSSIVTGPFFNMAKILILYLILPVIIFDLAIHMIPIIPKPIKKFTAGIFTLGWLLFFMKYCIKM